MLLAATIIFSLVIICLTVTQSLILTLWVAIPLLGITIIFGYKKKILRQSVSVFFTSILLSFFAVLIVFTRYNNNIFVPSQSLIHTDGEYHTMIATGTIIEKQTHNRYLRTSFNNIPFFLYTSKKHSPGDEILLTARTQPASVSSLSLFGDYNIKRERLITQWSEYSFDFASWQIMKGVAGSLQESNSVILGQTKLSRINKWKSSIQSSSAASYANLRTQGLVAGMLIGDRSMMSDDDYQLFIDSGIVHIIAVSGGNIVMLVLFLQLILFWLPFYVRIAIIIPCIVVYAMICGMDASVLRAVIMGSLSLIALFRGKQTMVRRSLLIAYITMLLINPLFLVYDLGFIFSFAALIGIVYIGQLTNHIHFDRNRIHRGLTRILHDYVFPSIGASMMVLPFLLFFTGKFNITSIIANMLVVPLTPIVMIGGGVTTLLQGTIIGSLFAAGIDRCVAYIYWIAQMTQQYAIYVVTDGQWFMYLLLGFVLLFFIVDRLLSLYPADKNKLD